MAVNITSRESMQQFRLDLIQDYQEGLPVAQQIAEVEAIMLRRLAQSQTPCKTCNGTGWEHITHRIRNRYVDGSIRCTDCEGRGTVEV